jgi:hypothetical protein
VRPKEPEFVLDDQERHQASEDELFLKVTVTSIRYGRGKKKEFAGSG